MASREGGNFNAACFRMSVGMNLGSKSAASAAAPNSHPVGRRDEGVGGGGMFVRKLERRGLWNFDLNVAPPEAAECEVAAAEGGGNGSETLPPPPDVATDDSVKKADSSDERELNFNVEKRSTVIGAGGEAEKEEAKVRDGRWAALLGVAENALRAKKEEEIRKRRRGASQEAELGGEAAPAPPKGIGGQRRQSLVEDWTGAVAAEAVVVRSTRGRAVAMPSKYKDSVLGAVAVAAAELPRHSKNGKSATVFCTKRKSR